MIYFATRASHKDSIRRLVKLHPDPAKARDEIYTGAALLLAEDNPEELIQLLDEGAAPPWMKPTQKICTASPAR